MDVEESPADDGCVQLDANLSPDEHTDEDDPEQQISEDDEPDLLSDLEWLEELDDEEAAGLAATEQRSGGAPARMFKLRRSLDQLDALHRQKDEDMRQAREEQKLCRQNIDSLLAQMFNLEKEMELQKAADNCVALFRLRAQHKLLCETLRSEEDLEGHINLELRQRETELQQVEVQLGRVSLVRQQVHQEEGLFRAHKAQQAAARLQHKKPRGKQREPDCQKSAAEGESNRIIAAKYLRETNRRMHQQEAEHEQQSRDLLEKRTQAVNSLKSNIAATQEGFRVQHSKAKARAQRKDQQERQLRESLQAKGINSVKHMYQQNHEAERQRKQEEFGEKQMAKRVKIVAKILQEEKLVKIRKKHRAPKSPPADRLPSLGRAKPLDYLDTSPASATNKRASTVGGGSGSSSSCPSSDGEAPEERVQQDGDQHSLAEPEFSGLWDQNYEELRQDKTVKHSEIKQEEHALADGKRTMPAKKFHGRELKGPSFISKPEVILFKDFEVGKTYKKKIVLTNISYNTDHCKVLGVSAHMKDFVSINFEPPGFLSAGMSFDLQAVFRPVINEDLTGEVSFASPLGLFSVPIRCTIKKCDLEVDSRFIDFGVHVVGQTISRTVTLTNRGALATLYSLDTAMYLSPETSHIQEPSLVSANTCQKTSSPNTTCDSRRSSELLASDELQAKQESQDCPEALHPEQPVSVSQSQASAAPGSEVAPEACVSPGVDAQVDQSHSDSGDISLGNVGEGRIAPFESIKLELVFTPTIPGEAKLEFYIKFSDLTSKPIPIEVRGLAVSVPLWVVQPSIDLKICMFDRLYQESITVQSRASTVLKVTFEVCQEMRSHMEVVPKTGFIQSQSSYNAQLKFLPRCSLSKDAKEFFDSDTGVLEVPLKVLVAGQVMPVHFTVQAVVTCSELHFDRTQLDFGYCSFYQSVRSSVHLTNLSMLPQDFGFLAIPEFIEVQPNDGFGTLLPQETLKIDLIFSANKAIEYNFQLCCKSGINRDFFLCCRAVGVRPPLELSHCVVQFGATAVGDTSTSILYLSHPQSRQPGPPEAPVAPRLFSFITPQDSHISISPSAGSLKPGQRCVVQVRFSPRLLEHTIREEALRLARRERLEEGERSRLADQAKKELLVEASKGKKAAAVPKNSKVAESPKTEQPTESPKPVDIQPGSEHYEEARAGLLYSFSRSYTEHIVPCYVSDGEPQAQPAWSPLNTLYLKVQCPAVRPSLVLISNSGDHTIDFQQVAVGERVVKRFTVQNISKETLDLRSSLLDIHGPFSLVNALRSLRPGEKHTVLLAFSPFMEKKHCESVEVRSQRTSVGMTVCGEGVLPVVTSSHPGGLLDFGCVLQRESASHCIKLENSSAVAVGFRLRLDRPQEGAATVDCLLANHTSSPLTPTVGTQNYSGLSVFSVQPVEGSIAPGHSHTITVTFQPDHPSAHYSDRLTVELVNKTTVCVLDLKGAAASHNMYLHGGDLLAVPIESLLPPLLGQPQLPAADCEAKEEPPIPVLVTLQSSPGSGAITPAVRELQVGCVGSTQPSKKSAEFHWENVTSVQALGFSVEPSKGNVEPGNKRTVTITWTPPSGYKPYEVVQACVPLVLKGDELRVYRVTLMAMVSAG